MREWNGWFYVWRVAWSSLKLSRQYPDGIDGRPMSVVEAWRYAIRVGRQLGEI
jgi:hypothetical protein